MSLAAKLVLISSPGVMQLSRARKWSTILGLLSLAIMALLSLRDYSISTSLKQLDSLDFLKTSKNSETLETVGASEAADTMEAVETKEAVEPMEAVEASETLETWEALALPSVLRVDQWPHGIRFSYLYPVTISNY